MHQYGLIGEHLGYSFSKKYFKDKFQKLNLNATYDNYECTSIEAVRELLSKTDATGFNVTIPYKESIISLLDEVDAVAAEIGAVNTIKKIGDKWVGYNTDAFGFKQMIKPFFKNNHERAIIFGTGGASKAVQYVLEELGASVLFVSRNPKGEFEYAYEEVNALMLNACHILVNATPVGTAPNVNDFHDIPYGFLTADHLCVDLVYYPEETLFLNKSKTAGANTINGITMLHQQAEKSWQIWNN
ncbi:shikimate dehydrogenase [Putridiphycobacter roseus]|uniref:Shikimate dehydrogenase n=1 Tax=Putridiphycobacter roseus TaxID=2219161 RepID=A0A2W1NE87_9FLAO|nr:shikimate dehydrogenase [Putridiphycobacter roseus]